MTDVLVWFWFVLLDINNCRSFNAKLFHAYIKYMIFKDILKITFLNKAELVLFAQLNSCT